MQTVNSSRYEVVGYYNNSNMKGWMFYDKRSKLDCPSYLLVGEAKYLDLPSRTITFCERDGSTHKREIAVEV